MKKIIWLGIFLLINNAVFSNDGRIILGSSVEIIDTENTNIVMREEVINISLHNTYYEVDVTFDFYNDGVDEDVLLGFPVWTLIYDNPDDREWAKLNDFKSYINGNLQTEYIFREESSKDFYLKTTKWFIREVKFPGSSYTYSRVTYKAPYSPGGFSIIAGYIFGTGCSWKGPIGKMTVNITHDDDVLINSVEFWKDKPYSFNWLGNGKYEYILENIRPEKSDRIEIDVNFLDFYGTYYNAFGDMIDGWVWDTKLLYKDISDIKLLTKNQVYFFIAFFYAMHGYDFQNTFYKEYFENFGVAWRTYTVNSKFSYRNFNKLERENINYLLNLKKMIPLEEEKDIEEFSVFFIDKDMLERVLPIGMEGMWKYIVILISIISICFIVINIKKYKKNKYH